MKTLKLLVTLALVFALDMAQATRVVEHVERAVELTLNQLSLPSADGGTVSFRECEECPLSTHVLRADTVLQANGQVVVFADLLRVAEDIRSKPNGAERAMAVVFLHVDTGRITRIEVRE